MAGKSEIKRVLKEQYGINKKYNWSWIAEIKEEDLPFVIIEDFMDTFHRVTETNLKYISKDEDVIGSTFIKALLSSAIKYTKGRKGVTYIICCDRSHKACAGKEITQRNRDMNNINAFKRKKCNIKKNANINNNNIDNNKEQKLYLDWNGEDPILNYSKKLPDLDKIKNNRITMDRVRQEALSMLSLVAHQFIDKKNILIVDFHNTLSWEHIQKLFTPEDLQKNQIIKPEDLSHTPWLIQRFSLIPGSLTNPIRYIKCLKHDLGEADNSIQFILNQILQHDVIFKELTNEEIRKIKKKVDPDRINSEQKEFEKIKPEEDNFIKQILHDDDKANSEELFYELQIKKIKKKHEKFSYKNKSALIIGRDTDHLIWSLLAQNLRSNVKNEDDNNNNNNDNNIDDNNNEIYSGIVFLDMGKTRFTPESLRKDDNTIYDDTYQNAHNIELINLNMLLENIKKSRDTLLLKDENKYTRENKKIFRKYFIENLLFTLLVSGCDYVTKYQYITVKRFWRSFNEFFPYICKENGPIINLEKFYKYLNEIEHNKEMTNINQSNEDYTSANKNKKIKIKINVNKNRNGNGNRNTNSKKKNWTGYERYIKNGDNKFNIVKELRNSDCFIISGFNLTAYLKLIKCVYGITYETKLEKTPFNPKEIEWKDIRSAIEIFTHGKSDRVLTKRIPHLEEIVSKAQRLMYYWQMGYHSANLGYYVFTNILDYGWGLEKNQQHSLNESTSLKKSSADENSGNNIHPQKKPKYIKTKEKIVVTTEFPLQKFDCKEWNPCNNLI